MAGLTQNNYRVQVDGKFFRLGGRKFYVKGVTYGPFAPNSHGEFFRSMEGTIQDFRVINELGANVLRVYYVPPKWFLDLALEHGLRVLVDVPWNKHLCFLDSEETRREARDAVRKAAEVCARHPAVFAISVVNEIPPDIVRWSTPSGKMPSPNTCGPASSVTNPPMTADGTCRSSRISASRSRR